MYSGLVPGCSAFPQGCQKRMNIFSFLAVCASALSCSQSRSITRIQFTKSEYIRRFYREVRAAEYTPFARLYVLLLFFKA